MAFSVLISAWLVGAVGGWHCMAMCGGFLAALGARDAAQRSGARPLLPAHAIAWSQLGYHGGRILTYAILGAAFGAAGASALSATALLPLQRFLYVTANVFLLLLGIRLALGSPAMSWLQGLGARAFGGVVAVTGHVLHRSDVCGRLALGLVWGLVPCALVYSVLPLALFSGGAWQGAAVMLAFGAGTVPNLLAVTLLVRRIARWSGKTTLRLGAAGLLVAFGVAGIYRVLFVPGALAHGAFCLVP